MQAFRCPAALRRLPGFVLLPRPSWTVGARPGTYRSVACALLIGNSDGIGLALTERLLAAGWDVVGVSRSPSPLQAARYTHHVLDVRDTSYPAVLAGLVTEREVAVCVYCAGIGEFLDVSSLALERSVFEVNLLGAVSAAQVVIPKMVSRGAGHFIGLSSQADEIVDAAAPSYAASKAGLSSYIEGLGLACRPRGVYVTNVRFGFVDTKMAKASARPFMISVQQAAGRVLYCMAKRPLRDTFPKRMAWVLALLRCGHMVRRWFM